MSGRRQGLRKSSRKGVDSSNDNAYSTCESTAESELEFNETTETSRVPHDPISLNTTSANPCSGTPTRQVTDADLDATPVQNNLMQQMHAALESSTNDVSNNQEDEDHTTVLQRTGQNPSSNGRAKKSEIMPTLQRQTSRIERDAECAAGILLAEAQAVMQREQNKQRREEESKLCMTSSEVFNERERVARYILEAPSPEARVAQQQLSQAIAEFHDQPADRVNNVTQHPRNTAAAALCGQTNVPAQQPPRRLRRLASLEEIRH